MSKVDLISEIIELQRKVNRARRQYELEAWMALPLPIAQVKSLFFISHHGTTNLGKLAAALGVTPTSTTGVVDRLVKKGLVSRAENPEDRRMLLLQTTDEGEELVGRLSELRERRRGHTADVLAHLSEDELVRLAQGFSSLLKAFQASENKGEASCTEH
jgi:DNA-binding MarR family transcriptional regulator